MRKIIVYTLSFLTAFLPFATIVNSKTTTNDPAPSLTITKSVDKTTVDADSTNNTLTFTINTQNSRVCTQPLDVMLVMDKSDFMNNGAKIPQPFTQSQSTANAFVDQLQRHVDHVGLVSYSDDAKRDSPLPSDGTAVKNIVNHLKLGGNANPGEGIRLAREELQSVHHDQNAKPIMIIFSDGAANKPTDNATAKQYALDQAAQARAAGILVISIGLTANADSAFLSQLASPNRYYNAPNSSQLNAIYNSISQSTTGTVPQMVITDDITQILRVATFVSADNGGYLNGNKVTWQLGDFTCNSNRTLSFKVKLKPNADATSLQNTANLSSGAGDQLNSNTVNVNILAPKLTISHTDNIEIARVNDILTYVSTINNIGNGSARTFSVSIPVPDTVSIVAGSISNGGVYSGGRIIWNNLNLAASATLQLQFKVKVGGNFSYGYSDLLSTATLVNDDLTIQATDTTQVFVPPPPPPNFSVFVTCVDVNPDNTFTAYYGYQNNLSTVQDLTESTLFPDGVTGNPPGQLSVGKVDKAFSATAPIDANMVWTAKAGTVRKTATASSTNTACTSSPTPPPPVVPPPPPPVVPPTEPPPPVNPTPPPVVSCNALNPVSVHVSPNSITVGDTYTLSCDYGSVVDSINASSATGNCTFIGYIGTAAQFNCPSGAIAGSYLNRCEIVANTNSNSCQRSDDAGVVVVNNPTTPPVEPPPPPPVNPPVSCNNLNLVSTNVSPTSVTVNGTYTLSCDYGSVVDSINASTPTGDCTFSGYIGTAAQFECPTGATPGSYLNRCTVVANTSSNSCPKSDDSGIVVVNAVSQPPPPVVTPPPVNPPPPTNTPPLTTPPPPSQVPTKNGNPPAPVDPTVDPLTTPPGTIIGTPTVEVAPTKFAPLVKNQTPVITIGDIDNTQCKTRKLAINNSRVFDNDGAIEALQYSLDRGTSWHPVVNIAGLGRQTVSFAIETRPLIDGNYDFVVRARDNNDDWGYSANRIVNLNCDPVIIGANHPALAGLSAPVADTNGLIYTVAGMPLHMSIEISGGPAKAFISVSNNSELNFPLTYNRDLKLWETDITINTAGEYPLSVNTEESNGQKQSRVINLLQVTAAPQLSQSDVQITLYNRLNSNDNWQQWDATQYNQTNPIISKDGQNVLYVPKGQYYATVTKDGFYPANSSIIEVAQPSFVGVSGDLISNQYLFGWVNNLGHELNLQVLDYPTNTGDTTSPLLDKPAPDFKFVSANSQIDNAILKDTKTLITSWNYWSPTAAEQLELLSQIKQQNPQLNIILVGTLVSSDEGRGYLTRGNYPLELYTPESKFYSDWFVNSLPINYFINEAGVIKSVRYGVITPADFTNMSTTR